MAVDGAATFWHHLQVLQLVTWADELRVVDQRRLLQSSMESLQGQKRRHHRVYVIALHTWSLLGVRQGISFSGLLCETDVIFKWHVAWSQRRLCRSWRTSPHFLSGQRSVHSVNWRTPQFEPMDSVFILQVHSVRFQRCLCTSPIANSPILQIEPPKFGTVQRNLSSTRAAVYSNVFRIVIRHWRIGRAKRSLCTSDHMRLFLIPGVVQQDEPCMMGVQPTACVNVEKKFTLLRGCTTNWKCGVYYHIILCMCIQV